MSTRPGTPTGVEDILTEILGELRAINAKLAQLCEPARIAIDPGDLVTTMNSDEVQAILDELSHPGRGVVA